jgi:hypothetical protein
MSNLIINVSFLYWHLQVEQDTWRTRVRFNRYTWRTGIGKWFCVHEWRPFV